MPLGDPRFEITFRLMVDQTHNHSLDADQPVKLADLPAFGVCGRSGSGKTALIEAVIPQLRKQGLKVAVVKGTTREVAVESPDLATSLRDLSTHHDLVLVESNHSSPLPKVWLPDASGSEIPTKVPGVVAHLSRDCDRVQSLLSILKDWLPLQWDKTPVFGCVLIGGKSRRMGYPKHLIQKNGKPWIQRTVELLEQTTSQVAIVGGKFEMAGFVHLADAPDSDGPMAGVLAALRWAPQVMPPLAHKSQGRCLHFLVTAGYLTLQPAYHRIHHRISPPIAPRVTRIHHEGNFARFAQSRFPSKIPELDCPPKLPAQDSPQAPMP